MSTIDDNTPNKSDNGAGLPSVIEHITQSGVLVYITPLSLFTIQALSNKAEALFPYPDDKPYREASDLVASGYIPASENPAYVALCQAVDEKRLVWENNAAIELACQYPQWDNHENMIAHFRLRLKELSQFVEMGADEWRNVLEHCVFTGAIRVKTDEVIGTENGKEIHKVINTPELNYVARLARQNVNLALTMPEVVGGLRVFRLSVSGATAGKMVGTPRGAEKRD